MYRIVPLQCLILVQVSTELVKNMFGLANFEQEDLVFETQRVIKIFNQEVNEKFIYRNLDNEKNCKLKFCLFLRIFP